MKTFNTYFNAYCTNIQLFLSNNTLKNTAKNTKHLPRIAIGWLVVVERGHMRYQIEAKGFYDSKERLDLSKIPGDMLLLAILVILRLVLYRVIIFDQ